MLLKTGDVAKRAGLTVRTLHHYEAIGLLIPSARAENGYRQYNRDDIARLHLIQALKRFGLSLAEIGTVLANPGSHLAEIVKKQIQMLNLRIAQSTALRDRLTGLQDQLDQGEEPSLADWLITLEMMSMYDKYFTKEEQRRFALLNTAENSTKGEWAELVQSVSAAMRAKIPAQSIQAQTLSKRWMSMLMRDSGGDPQLLAKLNRMHDNEPGLREQTGITQQMISYIQHAFAETKFEIYRAYLSPEEFDYLRRHYVESTSQFPALIGQMHQNMQEGVPASSLETRQLTLRWLELFCAYAGNDPQTHEKIRRAGAEHPELYSGTGISPRLLDYVRSAIAHLHDG